eukprot:scaffold3594_cov138-Cylindrotheca_fusiformis.AAC.6
MAQHISHRSRIDPPYTMEERKDSKKRKSSEIEKLDPEFFVYTSETKDTEIPKKTLTHLRVDSSVQKIPERSFEGCYELKVLQLLETVTTIGSSAFASCYDLEFVQFVPEGSQETYPIINPSLESARTVMFPERAKLEIEDEAFCCCTSLWNVNVCSISTRLGKGVFKHCAGLISVQLPEGLQVIGAEWFYDCESLPTIKIPTSVTEIGDMAFYSCGALQHVQLPDTMTRIGTRAFFMCRSSQFASGGSVKTSAINPSLEAGTITVLEGTMVEIEDEAFSFCESLRKVIIRSISTRLGKGVFRYCSGLIYVDLPEGLQVIVAELFYGCELLPTIKIPSSVIKIDSCAFKSCTALKHVQLPETLTSIGKAAFYDCNKLEFVEFVPEGSQETYPTNPSLEAGTMMFPERAMLEIEEEAFCRCKSLRKVIVCSITTRLGKGVFKDCSGLISVDLPEGLQVIEVESFSCCESLPTIKIPSSVIEIGDRAFTRCEALKHVQLPETLASIGCSAFGRCYKLEFVQFVPEGSQQTYPTNPSLQAGTIIFPQRANLQIDICAFSHCHSLRKVIISSVSTRLGKGVFYYCSGLISVDLPEGLEVIEENLFYGCQSLPTIKIPSSVIKIGSCAFTSCRALKHVQLPETLSNIGRSAFADCYELEFVQFLLKGARETYPTSPSLEAGGAVMFPNRAILEIEDEAFSLCKRLRNLIIRSISTRLGKGVFQYCSGLISVELPEGLQVIEAELFNNCSALPTIKIPSSVIKIW